MTLTKRFLWSGGVKTCVELSKKELEKGSRGKKVQTALLRASAGKMRDGG